MIKEIYHFFRYGPNVQKQQKELVLVGFMKKMAKEMDSDGFDSMRMNLVGDLEGDILEIGTGTGATFAYYGQKATVTAIEPDDDFRVAAEKAAKEADANIHVIHGEGEKLPFDDESFDSISASLVLCAVTSPSRTLEEFKRVLRPGGQIRLMEHVRSEHWLAGPLLDLLNPLWLRINKIGCNWNRKTVEYVLSAGFKVLSIEPYKIYSKATPAVFPIRIIKAERPA
jgi:ubiquinone/menaquinone biosynthesis C-methylase UbiE